MQLSLNGWPPVASHVTCILVGMSIAHLSRGAPDVRVRIPPKAIALALPPGALPPGLSRGTKVHLIRGSDGSGCRLSRTPFAVLDPQAILTLPFAEAGDLGAALSVFKASAPSSSAIRAVSGPAGAALPPCRSSAKVVYGPR